MCRRCTAAAAAAEEAHSSRGTVAGSKPRWSSRLVSLHTALVRKDHVHSASSCQSLCGQHFQCSNSGSNNAGMIVRWLHCAQSSGSCIL